jgi:hypothetical protein
MPPKRAEITPGKLQTVATQGGSGYPAAIAVSLLQSHGS